MKRSVTAAAILAVAVAPQFRSGDGGSSSRSAPGVAPCSIGRFQFDRALPAQPGTTTPQAISLENGLVTLDDLCRPAQAWLSVDPRGNTLLKARWTTCDGLRQGAWLTATLDGATCSAMSGRLMVPDLRLLEPITASRIRCSEFDTDGAAGDCLPLDRRALHEERARAVVAGRGYPLKGVPKGTLATAMRDLAVAPLALDQWVNLGPAPINRPAGLPYSGRVNAIAIDPSDPQHWLAGAATGGVWETDNGGQTWSPRTDDQPTLAISTVAFAPGDSTRAYAGTGSYDPDGSAVDPGQGILRSTDGGTTWALVGTSALEELTPAALRVSSSNPNHLVIAALDRFGLQWLGLAPAPASPAGIYESQDAGGSWALQLKGAATDVVVHPTKFGWRYAALASEFLSPQPSGGVFRSMNDGVNWEAMKGPWAVPPEDAQEIRLAVSPSQPDTVYVSVKGGGDKTGTLIGLFRSDNAWTAKPAWSQVPITGLEALGVKGSTPYGYVAGMNTHEVSVDPANPGIVFAAGIALWRFANGAWTDVTGDIHADQRALGWAGSRIVVGNDGGVYSRGATDKTWSHHNTNLSITQLWAGTAASDDPGHLLAGAQDNGILVRTPGINASWMLKYGGDGMAALAGDVPQHWLSSLQWLNLVRGLSDGGPFQGTGFDITEKVSPFQVPVARCPTNANRVLVGAKRVWRSNNFFSAPTVGAITFSAISDPVDTTNNSLNGLITVLAVAPSDPNCLTYALGSDKGLLFMTIDGGATWQDLDAGNQVPNRAVTGLAFSPASSSTLFVTLSGVDEGTPGQPGHLFRTTSATAVAPTWQNVGPPINIPHTTVTLGLPGTAFVYVGTDLGLWISNDNAATWALAGPAKGLPRVPVTKIEVDKCGVTAFTFGRGVFRNSVPALCP